MNIELSFPILFYIITAGLFYFFEKRHSVREINRKLDFKLDLFSAFWSFSIGGIFVLLGPRLLDSLLDAQPKPLLSHPVLNAVIFFLIADFLKYIMHVWMHSSKGWPSHRLHHSPTEMYWLSGSRASLIMLFLFYAPLGVLIWAMGIGPMTALANTAINILWNHLMHTSVALPYRLQYYLEWFVVTPRYHWVHHAVDSKLRNANYGSVLTIWDRLFKTYYDPARAEMTTLRMGADSKNKSLLTMLLGINARKN